MFQMNSPKTAFIDQIYFRVCLDGLCKEWDVGLTDILFTH